MNCKTTYINRFTKGLISLLLAVLMIFSPVVMAYTTGCGLFGTTAYAADYTYTYYPKCASSYTSLVDALKSINVDSSYSNRKSIAALNGYSNYTGTAAQNTQLLNLLKAGKLIKAKTAASSTSSSQYYPRYTGSSNSLVDALNAVGVDSSYSYRARIAAANGISSYSGTASQNTAMLNLLKNGTLKRAETAGTTSGGTSSGNISSSGSLVSSNLSHINYIKQGSKTCKASSVAMALNLILGTNSYTTSSMGNSNCTSIDGKTYKGSDGNTYKATYKTDSYVGSASELTNAIEKAVSNGLPIVIAVHSTKSGGTSHHWIVVVGKSGSDYIIVDPAVGSSGTMSANTKTMSSANYALGLTDYSQTHYGYVSFTKA